MATASIIAGFLVCILGLLLYDWIKNFHHQGSRTKIMSKRVCKFLICLAFVIISASFVIDQTHITSFFFKYADRNVLIHSETGRFDYTFTRNGFRKIDTKELEVDLNGYLSNRASEFKSYMNQSLLESPTETNKLSKELKTHIEVIKEAQRLHFNVLEKALKKYKHAVLLDIAAFENKGDPCITVGEVYFLARINLNIIYYCNFDFCTKANLQYARTLVSKYSNKELVILIHGGGNLVGYSEHDLLRFQIIRDFSGYQMFVLPQSLWIPDFDHPHFKECIKVYCCNENITLVLRDQQSYNYAKRYFNGTSKLLMMPDMAFQIGPVDRFISPVFDIKWIKRIDRETPGYKTLPNSPPDVRVHISDWIDWKTPVGGSSLENAFYMCTNGLFYLQRGRVIITDRLHGHILAALMNIPHVLIDNKAKKLSAYYNTWTRSLENVLITDNPKEALNLALGLLEKYKDVLPPRIPFLNLSEVPNAFRGFPPSNYP